MKDYYKHRLEQSMADAVDIAAGVEQKRGITLPDPVVGNMGLSLFETRVNHRWMKWHESKHEKLPDLGDGRDVQ